MSNPFDLLGNDVEDASDVQYVPKEIVRQSTSSKKADAPPASANKDRANKNRPQPTGNEAAFRDKSAGRSANKAKGVEEPKQQKRSPKSAPKDRQSRTGKTDSSKKVKQAGWTADAETELEAETEAAQDAEEELEADAEPKQVKKSFADYLKEQEQTSVQVTRSTRTVEAIDEADVIVKEEESFIAASKTKNLKSKQLKSKTFLDFDATFSDELPRAPTNSTRGAKGPRGGRGNARGRGGNTRGPRAPKAAKGPKIDDENFPSLA